MNTMETRIKEGSNNQVLDRLSDIATYPATNKQKGLAFVISKERVRERGFDKLGIWLSSKYSKLITINKNVLVCTSIEEGGHS